MAVKRITIRVSPALHHQLQEAAAEHSVSLNTLAVRALETYVETQAGDRDRLPLQELGALLAPAAEAADLTEEELLYHAREVRGRIWRERYEREVQKHQEND